MTPFEEDVQHVMLHDYGIPAEGPISPAEHETATEWTKWYAAKYNLRHRDLFTLKDAHRTLARFGINSYPGECCSSCGSPFNNANPTKSGRCIMCDA